MELVTVNCATADLLPSQRPLGAGKVTWVVYEGGRFLRSFNSPMGAQTFIDGIKIRRMEQAARIYVERKAERGDDSS